MSIHKGDAMTIFSEKVWLVNGWSHNVRIEIKDGLVTYIETDTVAKSGDVSVDTLLPALANLHSHSFQRAMAGMTEFKLVGQDNFWTWRNLMYHFLEHLTPDHIEAIAALVFMEMQESGYASVGEFHYLHHQKGGFRYDDPAEMSMRIMAAAAKTSIGLTHLPVLYTYGGAQRAPIRGGQLRFGHSVDQFAKLVDSAKGALTGMPPDTKVGIAPHSLRSTAPDELSSIINQFSDGPIHIHISEQPKEVVDILDWLGAKPVEWILDNQQINENWCMIHATHMTPKETRDLAKSGAVVGLCPITEANLGDGPFNGSTYLEAGGTFGLGSDSNIKVSLTQELRMLEYSQRLRDLQRNLFVKGSGSVGKSLYLNAAEGGAKALSRNSGSIEVGRLADLVAINSSHQQLCGLDLEHLFDGLCFAADDVVVTDVWSAGRHCVKEGAHVMQQEIVANYMDVIKDLRKCLGS